MNTTMRSDYQACSQHLNLGVGVGRWLAQMMFIPGRGLKFPGGTPLPNENIKFELRGDTMEDVDIISNLWTTFLFTSLQFVLCATKRKPFWTNYDFLGGGAPHGGYDIGEHIGTLNCDEPPLKKLKYPFKLSFKNIHRNTDLRHKYPPLNRGMLSATFWPARYVWKKHWESIGEVLSLPRFLSPPDASKPTAYLRKKTKCIRTLQTCNISLHRDSHFQMSHIIWEH